MQNQALEFTLLSNHHKNDGRYTAKIVNQKTIWFENLLKEMENNTALRKEDIRLAISHFLYSIKDNLIRGLNKVETPLGVFKTSIRGFDTRAWQRAGYRMRRVSAGINPCNTRRLC